MWSTQFHPNLVVNIPFTFGLAFLLPVQTLRWYRGSDGELNPVFWFVVEPPIPMRPVYSFMPVFSNRYAMHDVP